MTDRTPQGDRYRRRVIFHGRVQGVGFRATACSIARRYAVGGYVRNRSDGTVELEAEGEASNVADCLDAVREAFRGNITEEEHSEQPPGDDATNDFVIRY